MAKYMIHYVPQRRWYVDKMLVPSMIEQGIDVKDIMFFEDDSHLGNLVACLKSFEMLDRTGGTWHLQDDVLISDDFKAKTEELDDGIVCGFTSKIKHWERAGEVLPYFMWFSFPCIRIPNHIARAFVEWFYGKGKDMHANKENIRVGKGDDDVFKNYILDMYWDMPVYNMPVNIVEHVDWLLGGSVANSDRIGDSRSARWEGHGELDRLKDKLKEISWL